MVKYQLRHGNDLLAWDSLRGCDVSVFICLYQSSTDRATERLTNKQTNRETVINKQTNEQTKTFKQRDGNKHINRQTNKQTNRKTFKQRDVSSKQTKKASIDTKWRTRTITFRMHRTLHRMPLSICLWLIVFRVCVVPSLMLDEYISKDTDLVKIC